ncbi:MAG: tetratricopeptide repeat protein [Myxococcales bacterium]|nr:tetratricopeptide repeat protein [Myxococcales bacterium]
MIALLAISAFLGQAYYTPEEAQALFSQANDAYYREEFSAAIEAYRKLIERGRGGPDVLFNLGTACLADGRLGEAVLHLERARRAGGPSEDVEANLAVARARQLDQVIGASAEEPFLQRLAAATPERAVSLAFLSSWIAGLGLLGLCRYLRPGRRALAAALAALSLTAAVSSGALVAVHAYVSRTITEAVVVAPALKARELPRESGRVSFEVHAGLKVRLLETAGQFVRIRLPNGLEGWTEKEGVAPI